MKNFRIIEVEQLKDTAHYELIEADIYKDLLDDGGFATHRIAMSMELEEGEDSQYPLEDILDKYYVHVEVFLETDHERCPKYIFGGELEDIQKFKSIIGKRAYNEEFVDEQGQTRVKLIIE